MKLIPKLKKEHIFIADKYEDTDGFYADYALFLKEKGLVKDSDVVKRLFIKRENVHSTVIDKGAAAPHIYSGQFSEFIFSLAYFKQGADFKAPNNGKVYLVFLIMSDERDVALHLKSLSHIARLVRSTDIVEAIKKAESADDIYALITEKEASI
ncbi:MAG: PTS sugar transporter subunit IIA [bacterium]|nr:PTS sugar transporter subunit IIA [bacterium]